MNQPIDLFRDHHLDILPELILDESPAIGLTDLTQVCGISAEILTLLVGEGLLAPLGKTPEDWLFDTHQINRIRRALRLSQDLELDWPATALTLDLLDEIQHLRQRIHCLELQLGRWD